MASCGTITPLYYATPAASATTDASAAALHMMVHWCQPAVGWTAASTTQVQLGLLFYTTYAAAGCATATAFTANSKANAAVGPQNVNQKCVALGDDSIRITAMSNTVGGALEFQPPTGTATYPAATAMNNAQMNWICANQLFGMCLTCTSQTAGGCVKKAAA